MPSHDADNQINKLGIILPVAARPIASYIPTLIIEPYLYISGQLPLGIGELNDYIGQLGTSITIEQGKEAARICALNILSQAKEACRGSLNPIARCVKLTVFVHSAPHFTDHPTIANGASDLMVEVFGAAGQHVRAAVGVSQLPRGVAVEVEATFLLK